MSKSSIDTITRAALWHAYGNKCFLCTQEVEWIGLNIDHILAEHLSDNPQKFAGLKADYGLQPEFSVNDLVNLVPVHAQCNLRKGGIILNKVTILYYLSLTMERLPQVNNQIEKLTTRKDHGRIMSSVQAALQSGLITVSELEQITAGAKAAHWQSKEIRLPMGIEFVDQVYDLFYVDKDCDELLDKKIKVAGWDEPLELNNDNGASVMVSTLREYNTATEKGFYPMNTFAIKMSESFTFLDDLISKLKAAKMPKVSFISEPWLDITDLDYLSPSVIQDFEGKLEKYITSGVSVGELVRKGVIKNQPAGQYPLVLKLSGIETYLVEQFRADFNGDGIEDIFIRGWVRAIRGTLGFGFTSILTRRSATGLIEQVSRD